MAWILARGESSTLTYLDHCIFAIRKELRSCPKLHDQGHSNIILFSPYVPLREDEG